MTPKELQNKFWYVRRTFFPEWGEYSAWRIVFKEMARARLGHHDKAHKTIEIHPDQGEDQITVTIVHEIAHIVAGSHQQQELWAARMLRAAEEATLAISLA